MIFGESNINNFMECFESNMKKWITIENFKVSVSSNGCKIF